jgi:hypothetical protein
MVSAGTGKWTFFESKESPFSVIIESLEKAEKASDILQNRNRKKIIKTGRFIRHLFIVKVELRNWLEIS